MVRPDSPCRMEVAEQLDFLKHNISKTSADTYFVSPYFDFPFVDCQTSKNNKLLTLRFAYLIVSHLPNTYTGKRLEDSNWFEI